MRVNSRDMAEASWVEDEVINLSDFMNHVMILAQSQGCYFELEVAFFR